LRAIAVDHTAPALLPIGAGGDMADQRNSDRDEPVPAGTEENIRGVATDEDFDEAEEVDEDEIEDEEGGSTF
jgi:hypothetical protein